VNRPATSAVPASTASAASLKELCLVAAREVIAEHGVEALSMRDVARKLGVSHQAPYRHFASRDHLLAEIIRRCFVDFTQYLDDAQREAPNDTDLSAMGLAYMRYAQTKPLEYRLMFGMPWPEPAQHPDLVQHATHAFNVLRMALRARRGSGAKARQAADLDALFIWSSLHGLASIQHADVMQHLDLSQTVIRAAQTHVMSKIRIAMNQNDGALTDAS
jgi:AcrR family transcriptional regulator